MDIEENSIAQPPQSQTRFVRVPSTDLVGSGKIRSRTFSLLNPTRSTGDFLSRIWALYGPPDRVDFEGFIYAFRDTETNIPFSAYCAGSGPAFGGFSVDRDRLLPVLDEFEALVDKSTPANCEIEYETDFGPYRSGARNGEPFDEEVGG